MTKELGAIISLSWGYCVDVSITLTPEEWAAIKAGESFSTCGDGYYYEGEAFQDYWHLGGGLQGSLEVTYDDGGPGFVGKLRDARIEERPIKRKHKKRTVVQSSAGKRRGRKGVAQKACCAGQKKFSQFCASHSLRRRVLLCDCAPAHHALELR